MFDFEKLTRKWFDSDSWWLCILMRAWTASSMDPNWSSAILWSFLLGKLYFWMKYFFSTNYVLNIKILLIIVNAATYGKNLNAFTSKLLVVNASLISSSVTVALQEKRKSFYYNDNFALKRHRLSFYVTLNETIKIFLFINF